MTGPVKCRQCGAEVFTTTGNAITVAATTCTMEIMGSVKVTCRCGNKFRKSAGFIRLLPIIENWVSKGTARGEDTDADPKPERGAA